MLQRRMVLYCGACGIPPEYCEYGPDFETHCFPWLQQHHPDICKVLHANKEGSKKSTSKPKEPKNERPSAPWTTEERLTAFYTKYVPEKIDGIPALLEKYQGKEDKLFQALTQKYGPEPDDPYYDDSEEESSEDDGGEGSGGEEVATAASAINKKNRRGVSAKNKGDANASSTARVIIQKVTQKKRRCMTVVKGLQQALDTGVKLKDVSKTFSKTFAGSSSVKKENTGNTTIIVQGDHVIQAAELVIDKFGVPEDQVFLEMESGNVVPFK